MSKKKWSRFLTQGNIFFAALAINQWQKQKEIDLKIQNSKLKNSKNKALFGIFEFIFDNKIPFGNRKSCVGGWSVKVNMTYFQQSPR